MNKITPLLTLLLLSLLSPINSSANPGNFQQSIKQCREWLAEGKYNLALGQLKSLYPNGTETANQAQSARQALIAAMLGETYTRTRQFDQAKQWLDRSYQTALTINNPELLAEIASRYGFLYGSQTQAEAARQWYEKALNYAGQSGNQALAAASALNLLKYQHQPSRLSLQEVGQQIRQLNPPAIQRSLLLSFAIQAIRLQQSQLAKQALESVLALQPTPRQKSQALGYTGLLQKQAGDWPSALQSTQMAILSDSSEDLLIRWERQQAEILSSQGQTQAAIAAYRRALNHIDTIRQDIPVVYQNGESSFRTTLAPVYLGLIDLLLQQDKAGEQSTLTAVQQVWERFKTAELNDYFKTLCTTKQTTLSDKLAQQNQTAVIYPIILPDRLELLLSIGQHISRYRVDVSAKQLQQSVTKLYANVQKIQPLHLNQQLYQWLIAPLAEILKTKAIKTLVYIPDGILRKLPLALLHDQSHYLIEDYAIVTNPGLSMVSDSAFIDDKQSALLSGLSEPGPVIEELVDGDYLNAESGNRGVKRKLNQQQRQLRMQSMTEALRLPKVDQELDELAALLNSPVMKNDQFTYHNFKQAVNQGKSIIHIASHGYFSGDPESSFVMTYDRLMNMQQLTELFRNEAFIDAPVDLMTLSACQTAEGDDRAPLGLSGIVVQAGIHSAIGSLWPVDDEAAQKIFAGFYRYYQRDKLSKAEALRKAQLDLIHLPGFDHPIDWAGFILVGGWD